MRTQLGRFRLQKTVYLLKCAEYPPAQQFEFNIYHLGPYSPDLARAYYLLQDDGLRSEGTTADLPPDTLKLVGETSVRSREFLEGLTTLLDLRVPAESPASALVHAKAIKPHLGATTWKEVGSFLQAHPALVGATEVQRALPQLRRAGFRSGYGAGSRQV